MTPRAMPSSDASEREVLGVILIQQSVVEVAAVLEPEQFYHPAHRAIYEACLAVDAARRPIDPVTIATQLRVSDTMSSLNAFGGEDYLSSLQTGVVTPQTVLYHAGVIAKKAERRQLAKMAADMVAQAYGDSDDDEFIELAETSMLEASTRTRKDAAGPEAIKPLLRQFALGLKARVDRVAAGGKPDGVCVGLEELDALTGGFQPGQMIIIAGRPSMGKSALAVGAAAHAAASDYPALVFSLEMSSVSLVERLVSSAGRLQATRMQSGMMDTKSWIQFSNGTSRLAELPIQMSDKAPMSITRLRSDARRWAATVLKGRMGVVVVDYLQLVESGMQKKNSNREQEVSAVSRGLKLLAKEINCPVIALSQLNRELERRDDKRPKLSDLRESGALEQDADMVIFVYRDWVYHKEEGCKDAGCSRCEFKNIAELHVAKNRGGPIGAVRALWEPDFTSFANTRSA